MKVKLGLKNSAMLSSYFEYIFVHLRQKVCLRPELRTKFLSTLSQNPARTRPRPEKHGSSYNSELYCFALKALAIDKTFTQRNFYEAKLKLCQCIF